MPCSRTGAALRLLTPARPGVSRRHDCISHR